MYGDNHNIGALDHPLDSFKRELQQSVSRMNAMADEIAALIKSFDAEIERIRGYGDTIENLKQQAHLR